MLVNRIIEFSNKYIHLFSIIGRGDSGGPLMFYDNNRWYIVGIVSFGDGCSRANSGGIYTRVSAYYNWIRQIMSTSSTKPLNCSLSYDYTQIVADILTQK